MDTGTVPDVRPSHDTRNHLRRIATSDGSVRCILISSSAYTFAYGLKQSHGNSENTLRSNAEVRFHATGFSNLFKVHTYDLVL
jgi:hypothetical protein